MNKIEKFLKKLSSKNRKNIKFIISRILEKDFLDLDIKKLKGKENNFRIRTGDIRIIFYLDKDDCFLIKIVKRNDKTYKK